MNDAREPNDRERLEAFVAACLLIAQIDGQVTPDERRQMVAQLATDAPRVGIDEALEAFESLEARFAARPEEAWVEAELMIRRLKGRPEAESIAAAAAAVAIDGGLEADERSVVVDLCRWLGVSPARVLRGERDG